MEDNVLEAKDVYILMKKEYRISRNIRAEWYLERINTTITISRKTNVKDFHGELEVVSVWPQDPPSDWDSDTAHEYKYLVTERTQLHFLARKYRHVFCIDLSPSLTNVNLDSGKVAFDEIFPTLEQCLKGIVKPFSVPGSQLLLFPKIYVTIIAHTPFFKSQPQQVIVQGWLLINERENLNSFLKNVKLKLIQLQNQLAMLTNSAYNQIYSSSTSKKSKEMDCFRMSVTHPMVTPDIGFVNMLRYGIIALQLLPENSMAGIIVITDGVISLPDATMFDALLVQLRNHTISCSFLQVGSQYQLHSSLGYVPFNDLMYFLANATFGAYLGDLPTVDENYENGINDYHKALLTWGFQKGFDLKDKSKMSFCSTMRLPLAHYEASSLVKKQEWKAPLSATLNAVLSCRLREGYTIKNVKNFKQFIQLILVLPWKYSISIEYHIVSSWPPSQCEVQTEVWIEASYDFLNDVTSKDVHFGVRSQYRQRMVAKYWQTLKELKETDLLLEGLQSFPCSPLYFTIPECVQQRIPVFYLNSRTNIPEATSEFTPQFVNFWKPVSILNVMKWQKWFHTHRIGVILKHESPLPKNLHVTNSNGRYGMVQSRRYEQILTSFLDSWTDFTLIENNSYIKFRYNSDDQTPTSFFVVRITSRRLPCLTIHLAFLGGTSGRVRNEILKELKVEILNLSVRIRDRSRERKLAINFSQSNSSEEKGSPSSEAASVNTVPCCFITHKPIEKILIWYNQKPWNLLSSQVEQKSNRYAVHNSSTNQSASNNKALLCRYLHHKRWIWGLEDSTLPRISTAAITRILNTINRMRINDGFKFAYSCNGIVTMVREFPMKLEINESANLLTRHSESQDMTSYCVVQYTMFPPHFVNLRDSYSSDDDQLENDNVEADGEAQLITECWVEPQNGIVCDASSKSEESGSCPWRGLNYKQIPQTFYLRDQDCIWSLITYECLSQFCQDETLESFSPSASNKESSSCTEAIELVPYSLSLTNLLSRCLRAQILLSTFFQDFYFMLLNKKSINECDSDKGNYIFYSLLLDHLNKLHNGKQFFLSDRDNKEIPALLAARTTDGQDSPFDNITYDSTSTEVPKWRCFVKYSSQSHFLVTLIPSTYRDLKLLFVNKNSSTKPNVFRLLTTAESLEELEAKQPEDSANGIPPTSHHLSFTSSSSGKSSSGPCSSRRRNSVSSRQLFPSVEDSSLPVDDNKRIRYKSGPAYSNEPIKSSTVEEIEPCVRERACSLQSCRPNYKPIRPCTVSKSKEDVAGERTRKRNVSMPAKAQKELTYHPMCAKSMSVEMMKDASYITSESTKRLSHDSSPHQVRNHDPIYGSAVLPIYVFDCRLNAIISQLINRSIRENVVGKDICVNSTFKVDHEFKANECDHHSPSNTSHEAADKHQSPEPSSEESDIPVDSKCLRNLVDSIEKCHRRSFVMGVFEALCQQLDVHEFDVNAALDQCQEILLESNITDYLQINCGHLKDFNYKLNLERKKNRDSSWNASKKKWEETIESEIMKTKFPLYLLKTHQPSHELLSIHHIIQDRFMDILYRQFKPIPNVPNFYYYTPSDSVQLYPTEATKSKLWATKLKQKMKSCTSSYSEDEEQEADQEDLPECDEDEKDKSIEFRSEVGSFMNWKMTTQISQLSHQLSDLDEDVPTSLASGEDGFLPPLFLHFTCTVRSGAHVLGTCSVSKLPTCLENLEECFEVTEIDASKLSVTLDMLVMTLLGGATISTDRVRGDSHNEDRTRRTISFCSNNSVPQRSSESTNSNSDTEDYYCLEGEKMLQNLPIDQHKAVASTFEKIKWLVQDEMVSSKLQCYPITEETLQLVCSHVAIVESKTSSNCSVEYAPLSFVYGKEQSMDNFMQEFSNLKFCGYHLEKLGDLYYLTLNQSFSRKRHPSSSLVPSLNLTSIIHRRLSGSQRLSRESTEEVSLPKTSLSSPDALKSPFKKLQPKVSFESDVYPKEEEATKQLSTELSEKEKWIKRRERKERRDSEKRGLADSSDSENEICLLLSSEVAKEVPMTTVLPCDGQEGNESLKSQQSIDSSSSRPGSQDIESAREEDSSSNLQLLSLKPNELIRSGSVNIPHSLTNKIEKIKKSASTDDQEFLRGSSTSSSFWSDLAKCNLNVPSEYFRSDHIKSKPSSGGELGKIRHNSGPGCLMGGLQSDASSLFESGQTTEDGCEGDISNSDDCADWLQDYEGKDHLLPDFWLIVKITPQNVETYFHVRNEIGGDDCKKVHQEVVKSLRDLVKLVNQKLLLQDLHSNRVCSILLEPGCSEDIWNLEDRKDVDSDYLEATMKFELGAFACRQVWSKRFELHPRLKSGMGCKANLGIQALLATLNPFSVSNRKNMFVYEDSSGTVPNVFYLRLHEQQQLQRGLGSLDGRREESCLSQSSSVGSLSKRSCKEEEQIIQAEPRGRLSSFVEKDVIVEGVPSTSALKKIQDYIVLTVHGIAEPGLSIKEKLVQMLQKRLDETVLDSICLMLWNNRRHKLTPEDVHFIQPPYQSPTKVLQFSVNSDALSNYKAASYYLRQNMQDAGFTKPKYPDDKLNHHFQDFSAKDQEPSTESNIFLFVCSQKSGTKGVACIALSMVDASGNILQSNKSTDVPSQKLDEPIGESHFKALTHTVPLCSNISERCEAMFQFKIWESGRIEGKEMEKCLMNAIEHSLWDLSMERRFLRPPIFTKWSLGPLASQPTSPIKTSMRHFGSPKSPVDTKTPSPLSYPQVSKCNLIELQSLTRRATIQGLLRSRDSVDFLKMPKSPLKARHSVDSGKEKLLLSVEGRFTVEGSPLQKISFDEAQTLHNCYVKLIIPWLEYGYSLNVPAVKKFSIFCPNKFAIPTFMTELQRWTLMHFGEGTTKMFRKNSNNEYVCIDASRVEQLMKQNSPDSSLELIITNRNETKWLANVHQMFSSQMCNRGDNNMRFQSLVVSKSSSVEASSTSPLNYSPCTNSKQSSPPNSDVFGHSIIIPRHMFFIATLRNQELTVYTYNWMKDLNEMLLTCLTRMCQWTTARNRLLSSFVFQKLGLYHHQPFVCKDNESSLNPKTHKKEEPNPFVQNLSYIEALIKSPSLCKESSGPNERSGRRGQPSSLQHFFQVLRDNFPLKPLQESHHKVGKDFLRRHGMQMAEISRITNLKDKERRILHSKKAGLNSSEFTDQTLNVFKRHCRMSHFCLTPLLFLSSWRYQVATARDYWLEECLFGNEIATVRTRHESGTMVRSQVELRRSSVLNPCVGDGPSPNQARRRHATGTIGEEDKWHETLCRSYLKEFIQYLHFLGFSTMTVTATEVHKPRQGRHGSSPNKSREFVDPERVLKGPSHLIKNVNGGVIILQINFHEPYFSTTVYIMESNRTQFRKLNSSLQNASNFLNEIEHIKIVLHMHSFTYDYHLRAVAVYVANRQLLFAQGYHLSSFLSDFMKYYNKGPNFARNLIHADNIRIDDTGTPAEQLYNYLLAREKEYNMRVLRMTPIIIDKENDMYTEFILVHTKSYEQDSIGYEVTLLVSLDTTQDFSGMTLHLKFYVILTSRRDMYPNNLPDRKTGRFRTVSTSLAYEQLKSPAKTGSTSNSQIGTPTTLIAISTSNSSSSSTGSAPNKHHEVAKSSFKENLHKQPPFSIKSESVNYLGYYSEYEEFMQNILEKQVEEGKTKIQTIFNAAKIHCRRDSLWHRLTAGLLEERHRSSKDYQNSTCLNFTEFTELLNLTNSTGINELDPDLDPFLAQPILWYQNLSKIIMMKYTDRSRILTSQDGNIQHVVVLSDKCSDACMMLTVNLHMQVGTLSCIRKHLEGLDEEMNEKTRLFFEEFVNGCCFHLWASMV